MPTRPERFTAEQMITALQDTGGIISAAAKRLGCAWDTVSRYIEKYPTVKQAYENEQAKVDDLAEKVLIDAIQAGDANTARWWLGRRRRKQWGDNIAVDVTTGGQPLKGYTYVSPDDWDAATQES